MYYGYCKTAGRTLDTTHRRGDGNRTFQLAMPQTAKKPPTRRGFAIASPELVPLIVDLEVCWDDGFPIHAGIQVLFKPPGTNIAIDRNRKPASLSGAARVPDSRAFQLTVQGSVHVSFVCPYTCPVRAPALVRFTARTRARARNKPVVRSRVRASCRAAWSCRMSSKCPSCALHASSSDN